jgi:hypothetical protein
VDTNTLSKSKQLFELGIFKIVSGVVRISDPCYERGTWCAGTIKDVLNGTWKAQVIKKVETYNYAGEKVEEWAKGKTFSCRRNVLIAVHESFDKFIHTNKKKMKFHGGMDAGMAGIFDDAFYQKDYEEDYLQVGTVEYNHNNRGFSNHHELELSEAQLHLYELKGDQRLVEHLKEEIERIKKRIANPPPPDYSKAERTRDWYEICCDKSLSNIGAGVINYGVVSSSGYGDGGYDTYAVYNQDGKVVGIKIIF